MLSVGCVWVVEKKFLQPQTGLQKEGNLRTTRLCAAGQTSGSLLIRLRGNNLPQVSVSRKEQTLVIHLPLCQLASVAAKHLGSLLPNRCLSTQEY